MEMAKTEAMIPMGHAQTAIVMAKTDVYALRGFLERRRIMLQMEIDEITQFLATCSTQTDVWYDEILRRAAEARKAQS